MRNEGTLISVVTPIYNGAKFIRSAYDCLCRQTYKHWEWVVVDDGSRDDTKELMNELAAHDRRVSYTWQHNSGSAKMPRDRAVFQSKGVLIMPFDVDDRIVDDYLATMLERMEATEADIVYPRMIFVNLQTNTVTRRLPEADFDAQGVYEGTELVKETMPEWRIGCNGGLYRRKIWVNMSWLEEHDPISTFSDEVDERYYLMEAQRVAFSEAEYYYQNHEDSITNKLSPKLFHLLKNNIQLADFVAKKFGRESEEYRRANLKMFYGWRTMAAHYLKHYKELTDGDAQIQRYLADSFSRIDPSLLPLSNRVQFLNLCNVHIIEALMALKYDPHWLKEKLMQRYKPEQYRFKVIRRRMEEQTYQQIARYYADDKGVTPLAPVAIFMSCGNKAAGGLVDRLRGAVSLYAACKTTGRDFRIFFTHPFPLTDYLEPNDYDWRIEEQEVSFAPRQTDIMVLDTQTDSSWERSWQYEQFTEELKGNPHRQLHFYSNASFSYDADFSSLFHELFKPSERLQKSIDKTLSDIGGAYITVSARFCNLLGDFNEETFSDPLTSAEQKQLLEACLSQLEHIHQQHPDKKVVICSDSTTFADEAAQKDYVRVIPGTISHIGNDTTHFYHYYEKTFLDFFVISKAAQAYLLKGAGMHASGYPYAAARVGKVPYHIVEF